MLTFGYRFLYEALFAISFGAGGLVTAVIAEGMFADKSWMTIGSWVAFIVGGVLCGGIVIWTYPKSSFVAGVSVGVTLAGIVANSVACFIFPGHTKEVFQMICVVFGVLFVAFDLKFGKPVQIAATSIFGAGILAWGVGFFVGEFPFPNNLEKYAEKNTNGELVYSIPSVWWGYLLGIVVLSVFGILIQSRKTARSAIEDEFEGFGPDGFGYPIDAVPYIQTEKPGGTRPSVPLMDNFTAIARESDALPSSWSIIQNAGPPQVRNGCRGNQMAPSPIRESLGTAHDPQGAITISAEMDSATNSVKSLFGRVEGLHLGASILVITAIVVGGVMVVFGYRLIRATIFVIGFVAGGIGVAMVAERMFADESWVILGSWIAFGVGGVICGGIVTWLYPLSTFVVGAATGILTALIVVMSAGNLIYPGHAQDLFILLCVVLGFLFGVLTLKFGKPILIITTSLFGAGLVVWGIGYFAGEFPSLDDIQGYISVDIEGETVYSIPTAWWGYLAGLVVLFGLGMLIQFRLTARNVSDDNRPNGLGHHTDINTYVEKKTQREAKQDSPNMDPPPPRRQRPVRRQKEQVQEVQEVREIQQQHPVRRQQGQVQKVREIRQQRQPKQPKQVTKTQTSRSKRTVTKQTALAPRPQYANLDSTDEIVYYENAVPQQQHHRVIYVNEERDSELYDFETNRNPCQICGDYVHKDGSCCSESEVRPKRRY
ncbi:hypothetical protein JM16_008905 [Phytophthora kernoviae]|uniref:Transmembrane protein 198 n=1 Tax=Phytophthora kernoviae TaxID=325452 RepID=A0A8T0LJY2_9STRA|nr:hypothetical protein JM16_008905 [Phytophthora kernoviae]